jgi:hypothetical protein
VISSANDLLTCHDLGRFAALCNEGYDAVEGEYYLYKNWQFLFLGHPTYIWIRNVVKGHKEVEGSDYVGSDDESWGGSIECTGGGEYTRILPCVSPVDHVLQVAPVPSRRGS